MVSDGSLRTRRLGCPKNGSLDKWHHGRGSYRAEGRGGDRSWPSRSRGDPRARSIRPGIGPGFSQSGLNGPSIFPITSLGARGDLKVTENFLVRAAILDGVPSDPDRPKRNAIKLCKGDGALAVVELYYLDDSTKAAVGYWRYTGRFEDLRVAQPMAEPVKRGGNDGLYVLAERWLTREENNIAQGLCGWVRMGFANKTLNPVERYNGGGLPTPGLLPTATRIRSGWPSVRSNSGIRTGAGSCSKAPNLCTRTHR